MVCFTTLSHGQTQQGRGLLCFYLVNLLKAPSSVSSISMSESILILQNTGHCGMCINEKQCRYILEKK